MDAVEFCRESTRMCKTYSSCNECPVKPDKGLCSLHCYNQAYTAEQKVATVEQWAKEHPRKTRQSEFLKQWPNATVHEDGVLFCPKTVNTAHFCCCKDKGCGACRREFWLEEVNE